jgi:hypothetical protein
MDVARVLTLVGMFMSVVNLACPYFYSVVTYTDQQGNVFREYVGPFISLFDGPDEATIAAFVFLALTWISSACLNGILNNVYEHGFGEHDQTFPGVACCLSVWYTLTGTFSLLSLVSEEVLVLIVGCTLSSPRASSHINRLLLLLIPHPQISLSSSHCTEANTCELATGAFMSISIALMWFTCAILMLIASSRRVCCLAKVHTVGDVPRNIQEV